MPFTSQAQAKYMAANHPTIFKRWMAERPQKISKLPQHVKKKAK